MSRRWRAEGASPPPPPSSSGTCVIGRSVRGGITARSREREALGGHRKIGTRPEFASTLTVESVIGAGARMRAGRIDLAAEPSAQRTSCIAVLIRERQRLRVRAPSSGYRIFGTRGRYRRSTFPEPRMLLRRRVSMCTIVREPVQLRCTSGQCIPAFAHRAPLPDRFRPAWKHRAA